MDDTPVNPPEQPTGTPPGMPPGMPSGTPPGWSAPAAWAPPPHWNAAAAPVPPPPRRRLLKVAIGVGAAAGVAVGAGALANAATSTTDTSQTTTTATDPGSSTTMTAPGSATTAPSTAAPATPVLPGGPGGPDGGPRGGFGRMGGMFGGGAIVHGEFTVQGPNGYETIDERTGTVSDVTDTSGSTWTLTVKSADGTSGTFTVDAGTSVNGGEMGIGSVKQGDTVRVEAVSSGGTSTAKAVMDETMLKANAGTWRSVGPTGTTGSDGSASGLTPPV